MYNVQFLNFYFRIFAASFFIVSLFEQHELVVVVVSEPFFFSQTLLTKGKANPNSYDNQHFTALHLAAQRGRLDIIKMLVSQRALSGAVLFTD